MAVLDPLKVTIESFPEGEVEELDAPYWPTGTVPGDPPARAWTAPYEGAREPEAGHRSPQAAARLSNPPK